MIRKFYQDYWPLKGKQTSKLSASFNNFQNLVFLNLELNRDEINKDFFLYENFTSFIP
jgi:hypothetical protein